jgi:hypothetical protein
MLRIGGMPLTGDKGERRYLIFATDHKLVVRGLIAGDKISVYRAAGQLVLSTVATGNELTTPLLDQVGYVVKVNDVGQTVVNL